MNNNEIIKCNKKYSKLYEIIKLYKIKIYQQQSIINELKYKLEEEEIITNYNQKIMSKL